jgi:hypothetical protein
VVLPRGAPRRLYDVAGVEHRDRVVLELAWLSIPSAARLERASPHATSSCGRFATSGSQFDLRDDTIQRAIDWSASANGTDGEAEVAVGQAGTFDVEGLTIKHGTRLIAPGRTATLINAVGGATPAQLFALDTGPVQKVEISGFTIDMSALPTQHALYFKAVPILIDGVMQGGSVARALQRSLDSRLRS